MGRKKIIFSAAEFARRMNTDQKNVLTAIKTGRISATKKRGVWQVNERTEGPKFRATRQDPTTPATADDPPPAEYGADGYMTVAASRAMGDHYKALQAALKYRQDAGELVDAASVAEDWNRIATIIRKGILNIPDRLSPLVAAESGQAECWAILDREVRQILGDVADRIGGLDG